jgi:hypothetical protein
LPADCATRRRENGSEPQQSAPQWFNALTKVSGFLLNKDQTPFAPLYWDRYEQIKTAH